MEKGSSFVKEFVGFIKGFGVIGLAIGVVVGGAVTKLVEALVTDIISPLLTYIGGLERLEDLKLDRLLIGGFIAELINFLILMLVIWLAVKVVISKMLTEKERADLGM
jgi:large conductance mechanosensitive channel